MSQRGASKTFLCGRLGYAFGMFRVMPCLLLAPLLAAALVACSDKGTRATASTPTAQQPSTGLPAKTRDLTVSGDGRSQRLTVELAYTQPQREQGLMNRQSLADDAGMLFIFASDQQGGFWMKNTYIPLDIAFIDAGGQVVDIVYGKPLDETVLTPMHRYRYALEVPGGWFQRQRFGIGAAVSIPKDLPPAE